MAVTIETHGTEIREQFLAKMAETFDTDAVERKARCWDWMFNPPGHPEVPDLPPVRVLTAWHEGRFVGGTILGVTVFMLHGRAQPFMSPFGTNIDPAIRGLGINLIKALYSVPGSLIGIPVDDRLARVNEKYGAHNGARVQMFAPLRAGSILARRKPALAPLAGAGNALWSAWRGLSGLRGPRPARGEMITDAVAFGSEHDDFWRKAAAGRAFIRVRDAASMTWRFRDMPLQDYDVLQLRRNGELRGYVVVGHKINPARGTGQVTDILAIDDDPRDLALLFRAGLRRLADRGAEIAAFGCVANAALARGAALAGFSRTKPTRPAQLYHSDPDMMRHVDDDLARLYLTRADQDEDY